MDKISKYIKSLISVLEISTYSLMKSIASDADSFKKQQQKKLPQSFSKG